MTRDAVQKWASIYCDTKRKTSRGASIVFKAIVKNQDPQSFKCDSLSSMAADVAQMNRD